MSTKPEQENREWVPRKLTPYEQYLQQKRRRRTGRIIFWVIVIEAVCLILGAIVLFMPKEDPEIEELITKKVSFDYETESDRVVTFGLAVPKPNIDVQLLTINDWSRPGIAVSDIKKIVVHYLGNPETTAQENRDYFESLKNLQDTYMSANYVVGMDAEIIQCVPDGEVAWASNRANYYSISIENCHHDESGKFTDATYWSDVHLVAYLSERYDIDRDDIIRHYDVTGKDCPKWYVDHPDDWEQFKDDVMTYREECRTKQREMVDQLLHGDPTDETEKDVLREYLDSFKEETVAEMETSDQDLWEDLKKRAEAYGDH
jgi:N-acetyl-anhydromuramyl-L-alanine amidase AmpD